MNNEQRHKATIGKVITDYFDNKLDPHELSGTELAHLVIKSFGSCETCRHSIDRKTHLTCEQLDDNGYETEVGENWFCKDYEEIEDE